ncbi:MAG TPA: NAD-dependent epimerase/dehydratase family protein [Propionibacteriaceae bacterium]|nr:NAD-dependent epimerase/dehydratase family protein [Propionibacteriaceae bacterium]
MHVALVSEHASPLAVLGGVDAGGQNVHVAALAAGLAAGGERVTVYTRFDNLALPAQLRTAQGYDVVHVPAGPAQPLPKDELLGHMPDFGRFLRGSWQQDRPDVVHAHFWMSGVAAVEAAGPLGIPVVQTFHALGSVKRRHQGSDDTSPSARIRLETELAQSVSRVLATCSDEVAELVRLGVPEDRVSVVPCGVDLDAFVPRSRPEANEPAEGSSRPTARVVTLGRLVPRKGFDTVIEAVAQLPAVELLIAGGGPPAEAGTDLERSRLLEVADRCGVGDRVRLVGQVQRADVPALLRSADVVVCAPWYEPFGIVPLEAMACGVPVVATSVGGFLDTVVDRVTGLLVPPRDPEALAGALRTVLGSPQTRRAMGTAGRRRAEQRYSWTQVAADTVTVYRQVLASAGGPVSAAAPPANEPTEAIRGAAEGFPPERPRTRLRNEPLPTQLHRVAARPAIRRAVVLGGAGFVGSHLCDALVADGTAVICVDNFLTGAKDNVADLVGSGLFELVEHDVSEPFDGDLCAVGQTDRRPLDVVFHLASPASPLDYQRYPIATLHAGSRGTEFGLRIAAEQGARFVLASTSEVYGDAEVHPQPEGYFGNVNPIGPRSVYDEAKRYAEALTFAYRRARGVDTAVARIFNTYGPRMRPGDGRMVPTFIRQALAGEPMTVTGTGTQTRSLCYVSDTVAGLLALARSEHPGPVNIGNPDEQTVADLARRVACLTGSVSQVQLISAVPDDPQRRCPDISRAIRDLGWAPSVGANEGLQATIEWFVETAQLTSGNHLK